MQGEFAGVFGPVGCGKSSLLAAFLAEMDRTYGVIGLTDVENGRLNILFLKSKAYPKKQSCVRSSDSKIETYF